MKKILYTTLMLLVLAACNPKEAFVPALDLSESSYSVPVAGDTYTFSIQSNVHWNVLTRYAVTPDQPWISLSKTSGGGNGEISVTVGANDEIQPRTATLSIAGTEVPEKVITITQLGVAPSITIAGEATQAVEVMGGILKLNVTTNIPARDLQLTIINKEWIMFKDREQLQGGAGYDYYFEYTKNTALTTREASIKIYSGDIAATVKVIQQGEEKAIKIISYNGPDSLSGYGESFSVTVSANVAVSASITEDGDWVTLEENVRSASANGPASLMGSKTFNFMAAANNPDGSRKTKLTFFETGNRDVFDTVTVVQKVGGPEMLKIAGSSIVDGLIPANNGVFTVTLNTNLRNDIEVSVTGGWLIPLGNTGLVYRFNTLVNEEYSRRNCTITFKHRWSELSASLTVTQGGQEGSRYTDSLALVALYNAMDGPHWVNPWQLDKPITSGATNWRGLTVTDGRVTKVTLISRGLIGTIPPEFYSLPKVTSLIITTEPKLIGGFGGETMKNMASLEIIQFQYCKNYTQSIPKELGDLPLLVSLFLDGNAFTGSIPKELSKLTNLIRLNVYNNQLSDTIPDELYSITSLISLSLQANKLTGTISPKIGQLTKLTYLGMFDNQLEGEIPEEIGALTACTTMNIFNNNLTGNLPASMANLTNVTLWVSGNRLSGAIPDVLKQHPGFKHWILCNQQAGYELTNIEGCAPCQ